MNGRYVTFDGRMSGGAASERLKYVLQLEIYYLTSVEVIAGAPSLQWLPKRVLYSME